MSSVAESLQSLCEIIHVAIHRPRMTFRIKAADVRVGDTQLSGRQTTMPSWKLMPAELESELDGIENDVHKQLELYGVRFRSRPASGDSAAAAEDRYQIRGVFLIPATAVEALLESLANLDIRLKLAVGAWAGDPERLNRAIATKLGPEAYALVQDKIPSGDDLIAATGLEVVALPMSSDIERVRSANSNSLLSVARARTTEMLTQVAESVAAQPRQELAEALAQLHELISRDGRVTSKSFAPIRRAIQKLHTFQFVMDAGLKSQLDELSARLDAIVPGEQNSRTAAGNGLLDVLQQIRTTATCEVSIVGSARKLGGVRVSVG